jgi:hypothetical protein
MCQHQLAFRPMLGNPLQEPLSARPPDHPVGQWRIIGIVGHSPKDFSKLLHRERQLPMEKFVEGWKHIPDRGSQARVTYGRAGNGQQFGYGFLPIVP